MKKILATLTMAMLAVATGSAAAADWSTIRFGVDASYPPFESKAANGQVVGFDIDLGDEICRRLNAKCEWIENDFDGMIPALKARKFDGVLSSMTVTPQRAEQIAFSDKLFDTPSQLVAKKGSMLQPTIDSLKGKSIGVEQGTTQESYAKANWAPKGVNVVSYQNQDLVYGDLTSGRLDAAFQDAAQADYGFLKSPRGAGFAFAGPQIEMGYAAIGMRKEDTDLKAKVNQAITAMVKDGTYKKISRKYFNFDVYGK